jgi:copper resistance protein D
MADGWPDIALRFAIYADLMVLFGVPLFAIQVVGACEQGARFARRYVTLAASAAWVGAVLSVLGLMVMASQMVGATDVSEVTRHVLEMVVTRTDAGISWAVRIGALVVCAAAVPILRERPAVLCAVLSGAGAVALATLAWTGHGAMDDGARGAVHLTSDVLHLLAAGAWVGALIGFVLLSLGPQGNTAQSVATLGRMAAGFASTGSVIVAVLFVSGVTNYVLIAGASWRPLFMTVYGRLLTAKLAVFVLMLGLAAANRYLFSPRLALATGEPHRADAVRGLRRSMAIEAALGLLVLVLVAWLGVLSPQP